MNVGPESALESTAAPCCHQSPYEQPLQRLVEHHHTGPVGQGQLGDRQGGGLGGRGLSRELPLGLGRHLLDVLNTMREAQFEDLVPELVHNLGISESKRG